MIVRFTWQVFVTFGAKLVGCVVPDSGQRLDDCRFSSRARCGSLRRRLRWRSLWQRLRSDLRCLHSMVRGGCCERHAGRSLIFAFHFLVLGVICSQRVSTPLFLRPKQADGESVTYRCMCNIARSCHLICTYHLRCFLENDQVFQANGFVSCLGDWAERGDSGLS